MANYEEYTYQRKLIAFSNCHPQKHILQLSTTMPTHISEKDKSRLFVITKIGIPNEAGDNNNNKTETFEQDDTRTNYQSNADNPITTYL